jgi:hypothetical protein
MKADLGDWTGYVYLIAPGCSVSNDRHSGRVGGGANGHGHGNQVMTAVSFTTISAAIASPGTSGSS